MFKFNNNHIFTGYLKQKLSSVHLPTCRIYTREFAEYCEKNLDRTTGLRREDPRVLASFDGVTVDKQICPAVRVNYLKNNELYTYFINSLDKNSTAEVRNTAQWKRISNIFYDSDKPIPGLTKTLYSPGSSYDTITHEYLGDYLRFIRDYYDINLMSLYNCFNNNICSNLHLTFSVNSSTITFNSQDAKYIIYAFPVKLFANYTIAIDSCQGVEMFCGLYNTTLDELLPETKSLAEKTYLKVHKASFKQPFLFDKLDVSKWPFTTPQDKTAQSYSSYSRIDIINREQDLKLFIKVPAASKSSIVVLEGDYLNFNDASYSRNKNTVKWEYRQNHSVMNFGDNVDLNESSFKPISKLQLLELNTGESYPFADRLVEYLSKSAITPLDEVPDNIKRVQKVMEENNHFFRIPGVWENKIQKIIYDYLMSSGPIVLDKTQEKLKDCRLGYHYKIGHARKSTLYDVLGYVDRDAEKWYASWTKQDNKAALYNTIQNVDIYDKLYDL